MGCVPVPSDSSRGEDGRQGGGRPEITVILQGRGGAGSRREETLAGLIAGNAHNVSEAYGHADGTLGLRVWGVGFRN